MYQDSYVCMNTNMYSYLIQLCIFFVRKIVPGNLTNIMSETKSDLDKSFSKENYFIIWSRRTHTENKKSQMIEIRDIGDNLSSFNL